MEEQICELISMSCERMVEVQYSAKKLAAKLITEHVMKFIEWANTADVQYDLGRWPIVGENDNEFSRLTTEELYQYWLTNVKNK